MSELKNSDPQIIHDTISIISNLLSHYGWYIFAIIIIIAIAWNKYLAQIYYKWIETRQIFNSDPEVMSSRMEQMEAARRRQQELYDKNVEQFKQKELEKKLKKKQELEQLQQNASISQESGLKRRTAAKSLRDNSYNPLMGNSDSGSYRPSRNCGPSGG